MLEQRRLAGRAYPLDAIQGGVAQMAGLLLSVELDGKAVGLLLDAPDEGEHRRGALDADLLPVRRNKGARAMAIVLDHAEDRQKNTHFGQGGADRLGVHGTAVDEQGVRPLSKAAVAVEIMTEAACRMEA